MANNYLEFSSTLDNLSREEEAWLREQLEVVCVVAGVEYAGEQPPERLVGQDCWKGCRAWRDLAEYDPESDGLVGFGYAFVDGAGGEGRCLWFHAEENGSPEQVAHLVQKFLQRFRPDQCWALSYAFTCSKPRAGHFGGGCAFVTAQEIQWCCTADFLAARTRAFLKKATAAGTGSTSPLRPYDLAIDGPALRAQRQLILELADALRQGKPIALTPGDLDSLEGLLDLSDAIADQAADRYGIDGLLSDGGV